MLALLEGYQHFGEERYAQAAVRGARTLAAAVAQEWLLSALYFGLAGLAFALREVGGRLGDRQAAQAAVSALDLVALAATGHAAGRADLVDLALAGAADVVSRNEAGPDGFLVPHSDPQHKPERIESYSYGWCHGPAGDAQAFRLLAQVTGAPAWTGLAGRCWHTVTGSGVPQRLRPGFWDNSGHCCGTAGVLALACDRQTEHADGLAFASVLASDLAARAPVEAGGARWSNYEHRASPGTLAPRTGWAMGNAGIIRELLRYARVQEGRDPGYAVAWPDHPPAIPAVTSRPG